jgi:predicted RNA-binding Zn-ribbon protein involved in translation (DUF1610 family)
MTTYKFKALDTGGRQTEGVVEADSSQAAIRKVKEQGLFPIKVHPESTNGDGSPPSSTLSEGESGIANCHSFGWKIRLRVMLFGDIPFFLFGVLMLYLLFTGKPMWLIAIIGFADLVVCGICGITVEQRTLASFICPRCQTSISDWNMNDKGRVIYHCGQCGARWDIGYKRRLGRYG